MQKVVLLPYDRYVRMKESHETKPETSADGLDREAKLEDRSKPTTSMSESTSSTGDGSSLQSERKTSTEDGSTSTPTRSVSSFQTPPAPLKRKKKNNVVIPRSKKKVQTKESDASSDGETRKPPGLPNVFMRWIPWRKTSRFKQYS